MKRAILFAIVLLALAGKTRAQATYNAASCSTAAIQAAITAEQATPANGDIINVPSCPSNPAFTTIPNPISTSVSLTIRGQTTISTNCANPPTQNNACTATDNTLLIDGRTGGGSFFNITMTGSGSQVVRITGFTFNGSTSAFAINGEIRLYSGAAGQGQGRIDHNHFIFTRAVQPAAAFIGTTGVADHNVFDTGGNNTNGISVNSASDGAANWAAASGFGTSNFWFFENNTFNSGYADDCKKGGRWVYRHNVMYTSGNSAVQSHSTGSDPSGSPNPQGRGCRASETYGNYFFSNNFGNSAQTSFQTSGTALQWGDTISGYTYVIATVSDRDNSGQSYVQSQPPTGWGYCGSAFNGFTSGWDGNNPSATAGYPCLDQVGRGQGDLLTGVFNTVCDSTLGCSTNNGQWPNQALEPIYLWMETISNQPAWGGLIGSNSPNGNIVANREWYAPNPAFAPSTTSASNLTTGTGYGTHANRPASCAAGPAGTRIPAGGRLNGVAYWETDTNTLFVCYPANTWTSYYTPFTYPHPLVSGAVTLSPNNQNFGSSVVGSPTAPVTFTLVNGSVSTATSITPTVTGGNTGDFAITNSGAGSCATGVGGANSITAGNSCSFTVIFTPGGAGARSTTLSVSYSSGDGASPQTSALSGTGSASVVVPTITTTTATAITTNAASSGGTITATGGAAITAENVCFSLNSGMTSPVCIAPGAVSQSSFTVTLSPLTQGTPYFYQASATNSAGTGFGTINSFTTTSTCTTPLVIGIIGSYTVCNQFYIDITTASTVTAIISPFPGNGMMIFGEYCANASCNSAPTQTFTKISDNINDPEPCFVQAPHSPYAYANTNVPDFETVAAWYCPSMPVGVTSITLTTSATVNYLQINAVEIKAGSVAATGFFENVDRLVHAGAVASTTATVSTSGLTVNPNDLVMATISNCGAQAPATRGPGYVGIIENPGTTPGHIIEAKSTSTIGTQTATTTWTGTVTSNDNCSLGAGPASFNDTWFGAIVPLKGNAVNLSVPATFFGMHVKVGSTSFSTPILAPIVVGAQGKPVATLWPYMETARGTYNFQNMDNAMVFAQAHNVPIFIGYQYEPQWAVTDTSACFTTSGVSKCPSAPSDLNVSAACQAPLVGTTTTDCQLKEWTTTLVQRYKSTGIQTGCTSGNPQCNGVIQMYEGWNEPTTGSGVISSADLVTLSTDYLNTVRANDPNAQVCSPAFIINPTFPSYATLMTNFFANGGPNTYDCYDFHINEPTPEAQITDINTFKSILSTAGIVSPTIYATESGRWGDCGVAISGMTQQAYVARIELLYWSNNIKRHYWYAYDSCAPLTNQPATSTLNATGIGYGIVEGWMTGATLTAPCSANGTVWTCAMNKPGGIQSLAVWNTAGNSTFSVPSQYSQYQDLEGNVTSVSGSTVTIGTEPLLLVNLPTLPAPMMNYTSGVYTSGTIALISSNSINNGTSINPLLIYDINPGATICYRTDGVTPTAAVAGTCDVGSNSGTVSPDGNNQATPTIAANSTVVAIATQAGFTNSAPTTNTYTFAAGCATPVLSNVFATPNSAGTQVTFSWTTDIPATTQLFYGVINMGQFSPLQTAGVTSHSVTIPTIPGTTYVYNTRSTAVSPSGVCGSGYVVANGGPPSVGTPLPAGAFDYNLSVVGPQYVTQGKGIYLQIIPHITQGAYTILTMQIALSGLPPNLTSIRWSDPSFFGGANTVFTTTFANDTVHIHDNGAGTPRPQEPYILTSGTTTPGTYNVTITASAIAGCASNCPATKSITWPITVVSSSAPYSGVALQTGTPSYPTIPGVATFKSDATTYGIQNCAQDTNGPATGRTIRPNDNTNLTGNGIAVASTFGSWFYDGLLANYEIGNMLQGDGNNWAQCYENQKNWYTKHYAYPIVANGIANTLITFSKGAYTDFLVTGDPVSKGQVSANILTNAGNSDIQLPSNGSYVDVGNLQRETAYVLRNTTHAVALGINSTTLGQSATAMRDYAMEHVLGQIDQLCLGQTATYYEFFMMGLQAEELIEYYNLVTPDTRIPPAIACLANWMYTNNWQGVFGGSFPYDALAINAVSTELDSGSCYSTLNNMIAPMFAWLYQFTGNAVWQQEGDEIFYSGTTFRNCYNPGGLTYLTWGGVGFDSNGKNFSQNYHWGPEYLTWRSAPAFSVTPANVGFYDAVVSTASRPRTITFNNATNASVSVTSIAKTGTNASSFTVIAGTGSCGSISSFTVAAHGSCTLTVVLNPSATVLATYNATLTVTAGGNPFAVTLNGMGSKGALAAPTIVPGAGTYSSGQSFAITGSGTLLCSQYITGANLTAVISSGEQPTTDAGSSCPSTKAVVGPANLTSSPTNITLSTVGSNQYLRAVATQPGFLSSPEALTQNVITAATGAPVVTTTAATAITLNSASSGGSWTGSGITSEGVCYSATVDPPVTPCTSDGTATPFTSSLTGLTANMLYHYQAFATNSSGTGRGADLSFTTQSLLVTLAPNLPFGNQNVNTTSAGLTTTLTNVGTNAVTVIGAQLFGTNFTLTNSASPASCFTKFGSNTSFTLPPAPSPNASCTYVITFSPTATIAYSGTFQVTSNATPSPAIINLSGTGTQATILWTPTSYNFGNVNIGVPTDSAPFTLQNTGSGPLTVALSITGVNLAQFAIKFSAGTCGATLAAGASCTAVVTFTPAAAVNYNAALTETDANASNSPQSIALAGSGVIPATPVIAPLPVLIP